jgi:hypothetical protein
MQITLGNYSPFSKMGREDTIQARQEEDKATMQAPCALGSALGSGERRQEKGRQLEDRELGGKRRSCGLLCPYGPDGMAPV